MEDISAVGWGHMKGGSTYVDSSSFPGGPPAKYSPGLALLSFGVQMGSSICRAV